MSQATQSLEGVGGVQWPEEEDWWLQRDLSPSGDDGQPSHEGAALAEDGETHRMQVWRGIRVLPAQEYHGSTTSEVQGWHWGRLHTYKWAYSSLLCIHVYIQYWNLHTYIPVSDFSRGAEADNMLSVSASRHCNAKPHLTCVGYLCQCCQREGHWHQAEAGRCRLEHKESSLQQLQDQRRTAA